jgi:hypothetical protein
MLRDSPPVLATNASPAPGTAAPGAATPIPEAAFDPNREVRRAEPVGAAPAASPGVSPSSPSSPSTAAAAGTPAPNLAAIVPAASPAAADASPSAAPRLTQVSIRPVKKTWVTIRKDVAGSPPYFEDWLYPEDGPLKLKGHKFWIEVRDPAAVQVTRDGQPLPSGQSAIQIE